MKSITSRVRDSYGKEVVQVRFTHDGDDVHLYDTEDVLRSWGMHRSGLINYEYRFVKDRLSQQLANVSGLYDFVSDEVDSAILDALHARYHLILYITDDLTPGYPSHDIHEYIYHQT